ncbi:MAG: nucleotide pyrophosphohydrolase [Hyphomonadaceae bacterium]
MKSLSDNARAADLIERLRKFRDERNWAQFHTPKDLAISVTIEAGELLELFQWRPTDQKPDAQLVDAVRGEVADVLLYLLLLSDRLGIDLFQAANDKITKNETRFPAEASRGIAKPEDTTEPR